MKVHSSFNQNISFKHLLKIPFAMFISLKNKNKELISEILNLPTDNFKAYYYQSQRAAFYDFLLYLKSKNPKKEIVVLPSYTCCVLVNAVLKAGLKVEFIDTKEDSLSYDPKRFQQKTNLISEQILAILIPSNFGESFDQEFVNKYKNNYSLILDLANTLTDFNLNDFQAVLLSFGSNKLLDSVYGGSLLVDSKLNFKSKVKHINLAFEIKSIFKVFNFIFFRRFLKSFLTKSIFYIFKNLNLFPRIISNSEKRFLTNQIQYAKSSKLLDPMLNKTLLDFKHSENSNKLKKLHASLSEYSLRDLKAKNSTCFYPILVDNPKELHSKLINQNIFTSIEWTFSQIVPLSARLENIQFKTEAYPNSLKLSKRLLLIPINNSLDYKSISNIIHIIFDHIHENKVTNNNR